MFLPRLLSIEITERARRWDDLKRWERRELGQDLRRLGLSYREIRALVPVAKGTLSAWCRDIQLTREQESRLAAKRPELDVRRKVGQTLRRRARRRHAEIRARGRAEAEGLLQDVDWMAGVVAYWSEGSKTKNSVQFANSDPRMVRLFMAWGERYLGLSRDRFTVGLHLHGGQEVDERQAFWRWQLGIAQNQFRKSFVKPEGTGHRKNHLYAGTASVRVTRSGELLQRILGWIDVAAARHDQLG